jgi:hypothetical protein
MKRKELKNIAKKIAEQELIIQSNIDKSIINNAEKEIMKLSSGILYLEDMVAIDELIIEILEKNKKNS